MTSEPVRMTWAKSIIARILTSETVGRFVGWAFGDRIPSAGLRIDARNLPPEIKGSIFFRIYEGAEIRFIARHLRSDLDVVELGSSIGVVSSHIARVNRAGRRLVCVEGNPRVLAALESNLSRNAAHLSYQIENAAIDYSGKESVEFYVGRTNLHSSTSRVTNEMCAVPATSLSRLLAKHEIAEAFALVMDIEGAEVDIFLNDRIALGQCQQIIAELHEAKAAATDEVYTVDEVVSLIEDCGFLLYRRRGSVCVFVRAQL